MGDLSGIVAMVTGAAGNLGEATARVFERQGASLALIDHNTDRLDAMFSEIASKTEHMLIQRVDLTDENAVLEATESVHSHFGRIDALVNTVGGYHGGRAVHDDDPGVWERMLELNLNTAVATCRAVVPGMIARQSGRIVNVGSRNAIQGAAGASAYSAAKSAVVRLTESLAAELKDSGITANCVLPGTIDTPQNREAMPNADHDAFVSPEAIASVIAFLCSHDAWAVSGAAIPVYGRS